MNGEKWLDEDIHWLKLNYFNSGYLACSKKLNRTVSSIKNKVIILKLKRNKVEESKLKIKRSRERWKNYDNKTKMYINKQRNNGSKNYFQKQIKNRTGKKRINSYGYVVVKDYSKLNGGNRNEVLEHVKVMSEHLKRPIIKFKEIIHHIDMIKTNNNIKNLFLCKNVNEHQKAHMSLNKLVKYLLDIGVIKFVDGEYKIK